MSDEQYPQGFKPADEDTGQNSPDVVSEADFDSKSRLAAIWDSLSQAGMAEATLRLGTHALLIILVLIIGFIMRGFYRSVQVNPTTPGEEAALAAALPSPTPTEILPELPVYSKIDPSIGIERGALMVTTLTARPREDVILYTVEQGDTLFGIAEKFGLKPETLLWANQLVLGDNPHNLRPGQELNILPVNGAYYRWSAGDGLNGVSKFFGVDPEVIVNYPGNHLDPNQIGDYANPNIEPGSWLIIPGGTREFVTWSAPVIPRDNPGVAKVLGPGACGSIVDGAVGVGSFIWPANNHFLSGFDYSPSTNHSGIDIDGNTGDAVYAVDNGVVVYAGWNNWGYGNVVVINHGNGWQTLYAHLNTYNVGCGQSVFQGNVIGAIGNTGNSSGSHLHYEMMYNGAKVNPWDYLP